jgi:hypothetical protein
MDSLTPKTTMFHPLSPRMAIHLPEESCCHYQAGICEASFAERGDKKPGDIPNLPPCFRR